MVVKKHVITTFQRCDVLNIDFLKSNLYKTVVQVFQI